MKTSFFSLFTIVLLAGLIWVSGCASSKSAAYDPTGNWNYTVTGTPNGDVDGTMIISKEGDNYTGRIQSAQGSIDLEDLTIEGQTLNAEFYYSGTNLSLNGAFEGDSFDGEVAAGSYDSFKMTANRAN